MYQDIDSFVASRSGVLQTAPSVLYAAPSSLSDLGRGTVEVMQCSQCAISAHSVKAWRLVSGIVHLQDTHILISGTCEYLILPGKGDLTD